jgi:hypothetical protein
MSDKVENERRYFDERDGYTAQQRRQNYEDLNEEEILRLTSSIFGDSFAKSAWREKGRGLIKIFERETGQKWSGPVPPEFSRHLRPPQNRLNDLREREDGHWGTTSRSPYDGPYQRGMRPPQRGSGGQRGRGRGRGQSRQ